MCDRRRKVLSRDQAISVFEAIDRANFPCGLNVRIVMDMHEYEVSVNLDGLDGARLTELQAAASSVSSEAKIEVDGRYLVVS